MAFLEWFIKIKLSLITCYFRTRQRNPYSIINLLYWTCMPLPMNRMCHLLELNRSIEFCVCSLQQNHYETQVRKTFLNEYPFRLVNPNEWMDRFGTLLFETYFWGLHVYDIFLLFYEYTIFAPIIFSSPFLRHGT